MRDDALGDFAASGTPCERCLLASPSLCAKGTGVLMHRCSAADSFNRRCIFQKTGRLGGLADNGNRQLTLRLRLDSQSKL